MKLISYNQLRAEKGITYSRDHLRRKCKAGEFPKPIQISDCRIAWVDTEIDEFISSRLQDRDAVEPRGPQARRPRAGRTKPRAAPDQPEPAALSAAPE